MKIGYLGAGTWGTALAALLSSNGHTVVVWDRDQALIEHLKKNREHPKLQGYKIPKKIRYTNDFSEVFEEIDYLVESVTAQGVRPVFEKIKKEISLTCPIILTSKGIEQKTGLLLPEIIVDVLGEDSKAQVGCISGPSHAEEVIKCLPTSVVSASYEENVKNEISNLFNNPTFRVYPNRDIHGVAFGGAMKNIIAVASGISDGLQFGDNAKAALVTRGLHEIRKLSAVKNCNPETLNGLAGLGDLFVTCASHFSRNYRFGQLIAKGKSLKEAQEEIGMVVEGAFTCVSAHELGKKFHVPVPITDAAYSILYKGVSPKEAVLALMQRQIKEEHL